MSLIKKKYSKKKAKMGPGKKSSDFLVHTQDLLREVKMKAASIETVTLSLVTAHVLLNFTSNIVLDELSTNLHSEIVFRV